ncbi:tyrosine phosphatase [Tremella mesenterica]|uniref:M-phase inducer phosphatase n=1 Tax=Tremella mesenterica TaxID=5217 RepID=A0A4Q1BRD2_TREME|nr:uncharacterized protein TREMEDRAFT_45682 [Tremella mesenterica DSM 1558]EIW66551.1 hypothetical protein TREMEDRAFT_45682 [Tremella mesenterica DSM 1558]RXK40432.1 tyrosine phosphatase [Tremella mesenterica]
MDFSSSPIQETFPSAFQSPAPSPTKTECELPDVDRSFNSSMCLSPCDSPLPRSPSLGMSMSMPISPSAKQSNMLSAPMLTLKPRRPDPVPLQSSLSYRSSTQSKSALNTLGSGRTFGRELSLNVPRPPPNPLRATKTLGMMLPPAVPDAKGFKRGGLPMQWTASNEETGAGTGKLAFHPSMFRRETEPILSPKSSSPLQNNSMDIDSPVPSRKPIVASSPSFSGGKSIDGSPGLGSFFCDSPAGPAALPPSKRRSLIDSSPASPSSSPSAKRASLGLNRNMDKVASSSAALFGTGRPSAIATRRAQPYKRPSLLPVPLTTTDRSTSASSAYPILYAPKPNTAPTGTFPRAGLAPMRRAYSVCDQPHMPEMSEEESEYEASPSMGAHAEYARRYGNRVIPRADGSPNFKPMRCSIAATGEGVMSPPNPGQRGKKVSPYGPGGLPGFGDNEMDGKILPCHKVKEDGLVRITADTLDDLLQGRYSDKMRRFHVLDCRFDYEYEGGHIDGAINVKSMDALDELLLSESSGVHANGDCLPRPSRSGELASNQQVILVFHCEFSAKRAPTFAKHLRAMDRTINNASYPKIYFPEVYILEGGYCGFYNSRPKRCTPQGYTPMDDPAHSDRRNSDLHDFRKFSRTKSFTYGETQVVSSSRTLPPCPALAFAAASAAVGRRGGGMTITEEDHDESSSPADPRDDSPCNRVVSMGGIGQPIFGTAKARTMGRMGFSRVASYAGTTVRPNA